MRGSVEFFDACEELDAERIDKERTARGLRRHLSANCLKRSGAGAAA
jgi:hypothetical protein